MKPLVGIECRIDNPVATAKRILGGRRRMERYFPAHLFGEPARDILFDLFIAAEENRKISVISCCIGAAVPTTTALRCIALLKQQGLIEAQPDPLDHRRVFLALTPDARESMRAYLLTYARS